MEDRRSPAFQIRCPCCQQPSDSIKQYKMHKLVVFILIAAHVQSATYTACSSCMRKIIGERMLVNVIPANLAWPVIALAWGVQFARTFSKGHSRSVLSAVGL